MRAIYFIGHLMLIGLSLLSQHSLAQTSARIIGGNQAAAGSYPWMVNVMVQQPNQLTVLCGGTLIDPYWVLTAAHCLYNVDGRVMQQPAQSNAISLIVGDYDRSGINFFSERYRTVSQRIIHPNYINSFPYAHDLALLRLDQPVVDIPALRLGRIHVIEDTSQQGDLLTIVGWGTTQNNLSAGAENILREARVAAIGQSICSLQYQGISSAHLCAGYSVGGVDSCSGDSGGPLLLWHSNQWLQIGIISSGDGCAQANRSGIYTNLTQYLSWLENELNAASSRLLVVGNVVTPVVLRSGSGSGFRTNVTASSGGHGGSGGGVLYGWEIVLGLLLLIAKRIRGI